jgi:hypothetical protein
MPSSVKKPLASATMTGANSPFRSQPSCVRTSVWASAGTGAIATSRESRDSKTA